MTTNTTDLGLPTAATPSRWARANAWLSGYTAHRLTFAGGPDSPYVRTRHAAVQLAESRLTERLHDLVGPLDSRFIEAASHIAHHNATLDELNTALTDITGPRSADHATTSQRRHERHRIGRQDQARNQMSGALQTISGLLTLRAHLIAQAGGILDSHVAAADTLISAYQAGYTRRTKTPLDPDQAVYHPRAEWASGHFPLMTMALDAPTRHTAEWAIREFSTAPGHAFDTATA